MSNLLRRSDRLTRRELLKLASAVAPGLLLSPAQAITMFRSDAPFAVEYWAPGSGNFRASILVPSFADAVWVRIPWRRRDSDPQRKGLFVHEAKTGTKIENAIAWNVTDEYGDLIFQPLAKAEEYYVYYLQYVADTRPWAYSVQYLPPALKADPTWIARHNLNLPPTSPQPPGTVPQAKFQEIEARTDFDRCDPMELVATASEVAGLLSRNPNSDYLLFPTERQNAIRMTRHLPLRWIQDGPSNRFLGQACRGEFFVFQIGIYAAAASIEGLEIEYSPLEDKSGSRVPAEAFRCFNLGGADWLGRPLMKTVAVPKDEVRALWIGVQIPAHAQPGEYTGSVTLKPRPGQAATVQLAIAVEDRELPEAGDMDLWRYSRLRWLDSTIGLDGKITAPYTPLQDRKERVDCLLRSILFGESGLPSSILSSGHELLAAPMRLICETAEGVLPIKPLGWKTVGSSPDSIVREYTFEFRTSHASTHSSIRGVCRLRMEFDGYINYAVHLQAAADIALKDIRLEMPFRTDIATHLMGLGKRGGKRPSEWHWRWNIEKADNSLWIGTAQAGLQCKLKGPIDTWDSADLRANGIPVSWGNNGQGGWRIAEESGRVLSSAYSGRRTLHAGETLEFNFGLLATPVKPLDPAHWNQRYYHAYVDPEIAVRAGANIINIHQGNELNPYINYPFWTVDALAGYTNQAHALGAKVKIYYTVRELTNHVSELWALRSLGTEIYKDGPGGGSAWLREHLVSNYTPAWHQELTTGELDSAILTTGLSRWHNYYLQGLAYLLHHAEIDGLYLDGIGYDRVIMQRVRRVLDEGRPGCLIDLHSGDAFPPFGISPANQYLEHFPYINSVWFGEEYNYNADPDFWLIEISGIPFGLFGEMLGDKTNPWRGMVYGMTTRYYQSAESADPHYLWKLWDEFGIQDASMIGYWDPSCPVRADHDNILVTVYKRERKSLVAIASWNPDTVQVRLEVNWKALGLDAASCAIHAPAIPGFQSGFSVEPGSALGGALAVDPGKGFLLLFESTGTPASR